MRTERQTYQSGKVKQTSSGKWRGILSYRKYTGNTNADGSPAFKWAEVSKTFNTESKAEAKRLLRTWSAEMENQAEIDAKRGPSATEMAKRPVADCVDAYISEQEANKTVEASTIKGYRATAKFIRKEFASVPLEELTTEQVRSWESDLTGRGLSSSTVGKCHRLLKMVVQDAVNIRAIEWNPVSAVKPPKREKVHKGINALDADGRSKVLSALDAMDLTPVTVAARIALYTGLREGEICGLQWRDIDLGARTLWVRRAIGEGVGGCYEKEPKTDKTRDVALPDTLADLLAAWRRQQRASFAEAGALLDGSSYVLGDAVGFMNPRTLGRGWATLAKALGVKGTEGRIPTFHDLRHTWATLYLAAGGDVKTAASNLGHANVAMTLNVYASADPHAKREAARLTEVAMMRRPAEIVRLNGTEG